MITLQRQVLEQNERQQQVIKALKEKSAAQLKLQQEETSRLRELLQNSADLTREVAGKQQEMRIAVEHEKALRLKSEASAKQALGIARTAIARLSKAKAKTTAEPTEPLTVVDSDD